jgi:hypothetical protein
MARPQAADGGEGLQIRRVAANIKNITVADSQGGVNHRLGGWVGANNTSP